MTKLKSLLAFSNHHILQSTTSIVGVYKTQYLYEFIKVCKTVKVYNF